MTKKSFLLPSIVAVLAWFSPVGPAAAGVTGVTTVQILQSTVNAIPSCTEYTVTGVCVYLQCKILPPSCWLNFSLRVNHYVPEVIVSTYHDVYQHPWMDVGTVLAVGSHSIGQILLGGLDSAGSGSQRKSTYTYKDADAVGNPVGMFAKLLKGDTSSLTAPSKFVLPGTTQLSTFPTTGIAQIKAEWMSIPASVYDALHQAARDLLTAIKNIVDAPAAVISGFNTAVTTAKTVMDAVSGGFQIPASMQNSPSSISLNPLKALGQLADAMAGASGFGTGIFCPGSADKFTLYYQSELDTAMWRGYIPVESLYASSWIPGRKEVSQSGANTWGSVYPRVGDLYQGHPVKASAVVAERVRSIITQDGQPHIYAKLQMADSGFRYTSAASEYKWQRLYPNAETSCSKFGQNDSLSLASWGDFNTTSERAFMWNLWQRYECCQEMGGTYLGTISIPDYLSGNHPKF